MKFQVSFAIGLLLLPTLAAGKDVRSLKIATLTGEGAFNDVKHRRAQQIQVRVVDQDNEPVSGAAVVFTLPTTGPGGSFESGGTSFVTTADAEGRASTVGLRPNSTEGRFSVGVQASLQGITARTQVFQSNTLAGGPASTKSGGGKKFLILGLIAAGAAVGGIAATHGGGSPPPPAAPVVIPTTISVGSITVGNPR